jgi:RNA polymerase sigma-B factor
LAGRAQAGDESARERLVRELMPAADRVARRFATHHHPAEDLAQVAGIGLLKAIDRFEGGREAAFATYAQALMTGEIRRHLRDGRLMRIPRPIYEQVPRFQRALERLGAELGRSPSRAELAEALELTVEDVIEIADAALTAQPVSLDAALADFGGAEHLGEHDHRFDQVEAGASLAPMLDSLTERERLILDMRFEEGLSQTEIGAGLGISQTQVSRILRAAIAKLSHKALATV